jgi:hypothetical protein
MDIFGRIRTVSATKDSTGIAVIPFLVSSDPILGEVSLRRGACNKLMNRSGLARLQKLLQRLIPYLTGFFPGAKLTA